MSSTKVTAEQVTDLASKAGLKLKDGHAEDYSILTNVFEEALAKLPDDQELMPRPDLSKYPRTDVKIPTGAETEGGGWATKATIKAASPKNDLLKGKTLAIKDNVAVAGVRCTNGTSMVDWTPAYDATIVTRILDAGGVILGKATCENSCIEGESTTSVTGRVHNPYKHDYSAGGSSSGSGRLVSIGAVDMAIGGDQGGSIRIPATCCGVVGLKPTWGLVPYTGILSLDAAIDHTGPMARTVPDCARLLEAIAGADGWDDRQPGFGLEVGGPRTKFIEGVGETLGKPAGTALKGLKVGIVKEGFEMPNSDANVLEAVRAAAEKFAQVGAEVHEVSVPAHSSGWAIWTAGIPIAGGRQAIFGDLVGRKGLQMTDRGALVTPNRLSQREFDALGTGCRLMYLRWLYCEEKYGTALSGKVTNLVKGLTDAYDRALEEFDILVMPTVVMPPKHMGEEGVDQTPIAASTIMPTVIYNTSPFDSTGHPSLSLPCGFVPAEEDPELKLPTGIMLVGRRWDDLTVLKSAAAWEQAFNWKELSYGVKA